MGTVKEAISPSSHLKEFFFFIFPIALFFIFSAETTFSQEAKKSLIHLSAKGKEIRLEVARSEKEKEKGLMFRERLGKDEGMLFVYEREEILSFWMKNTQIPLSIAFIDKNGKIVDIQDMEPFSLKIHISPRPAKYALEMNQGWFKRNGIAAGEVINLPPSVKR